MGRQVGEEISHYRAGEKGVIIIGNADSETLRGKLPLSLLLGTSSALTRYLKTIDNPHRTISYCSAVIHSSCSWDSHLIPLCLYWSCPFLLSAPSRTAPCKRHELWSICYWGYLPICGHLWDSLSCFSSVTTKQTYSFFCKSVRDHVGQFILQQNSTRCLWFTGHSISLLSLNWPPIIMFLSECGEGGGLNMSFPSH